MAFNIEHFEQTVTNLQRELRKNHKRRANIESNLADAEEALQAARDAGEEPRPKMPKQPKAAKPLRGPEDLAAKIARGTARPGLQRLAAPNARAFCSRGAFLRMCNTGDGVVNILVKHGYLIQSGNALVITDKGREAAQ